MKTAKKKNQCVIAMASELAFYLQSHPKEGGAIWTRNIVCARRFDSAAAANRYYQFTHVKARIVTVEAR